jgi:hypothetical protein
MIKPEHKNILNKLRELYVQSGGKPMHEPEDFGLNDLNKCESGMEIDFDYGIPHYLYTQDGSYMILGSSLAGDTKKFWDLLNQAFNVEIIKPKRNDAKVSKIEFQYQSSGPIIRIAPK